MLLIIFTQYLVLNIHASIANTTRTMAMEVQQQKKRRYCDCGFETTALSDYHTAEHQKSKRHRQAMTANKMQRLDSYFSKAAAAHKDTTVVELELSTESRQLELGEYYL